MPIGDWSTNTTSLNCSAPSKHSRAPGVSVALPKWRNSAAVSVSWISVDLPEPLTPVTHTRRCRGISTVMCLRLWSLAPCTIRRGVLAATSRLKPTPTVLRPPRYAPVKVSAWRRSAGVPSNTMLPPRSPGPGPMSISRSAASITAGSCSTTTSVLPASRKRCMATMMRCMSRGCRPMLGSSSTNSVLTSDVPKAVVRLMRCTSPPLRVRLCRSSVR
ncbi:hypothetical protein GALL_501560 [mine drainage metagenome]|uniref:Uncharacterized protein n=1 Tax=mine drainage metagenome TaxID=410659 RepID=A0A1J5PBY9_9ZZZZ